MTMTPPQSSAVAVEALSKRFGDVAAIDDLSFTVRTGAVTGGRARGSPSPVGTPFWCWLSDVCPMGEMLCGPGTSDQDRRHETCTHSLDTPSPGRGATAAVALTLVLATSAQAWTQGALKNVSTGRCLRDSPTTVLSVGACDGTNATLWTASNYSNGKVRFMNVASGWCLDDSVNGLQTYPCHSDNEGSNRDYQSWMDSGMVAGQPYIQRWQNLYTKRCLADSTSIGLRTTGCVLHTSPSWEQQAWRWSYRTSG